MKCFLALLFAGLAAASNAQAAISYSYSAGLPSYSVTNPSTVSVPIYLVESRSVSDTSLLNSEKGLFGAGFSIIPGGSTGTTSATVSGIMTGAGFIGGTQGGNSSKITFLEGVNTGSTSGVTGTSLPTTYSILLGTLTITGGSDSGLTNFNVGPRSALNGNTLSFVNHYDLDVTSTSPAYAGATSSSFTVQTLVPEPASIAALATIGGLMIRRRQL